MQRATHEPQAAAFVGFTGTDAASRRVVRKSWGEWQAGVELRGAALAQAGIPPGSFVVIIGCAGFELVSCFLAALRRGLVASIFPPPSPYQDPAYYLDQQRHALAIVNPNFVWFADSQTAAACSRDMLPAGCQIIEADPRGSLLDRARFPAPDTAAPRPYFVQHSSGTTGLKKGVGISESQLCLQLEAYAQSLGMGAGAAPATIASWLPLYHDMGLVACFMLAVYSGSRLVLLDPFEWATRPGILFEAIAAEQATHVWLPNFAFTHLVRTHPRGAGVDLSSVRQWIDCSEPCKADTLSGFAKRFERNGVQPGSLACCYAMAETVYAVSQTAAGTFPRALRVAQATAVPGERVQIVEEAEQSIDVLANGAPLPGVDVRVCVEGALSAEQGLVGELAVKSPFNFMGYYRRPELDREAFLDGFYLTGDIGFVLDDELYVIGRRKEMLIVHGKNYFATDLEFALNRVAGIKSGRVVAIGVFNRVVGSEELVVVAERDESAVVAVEAVHEGVAEVLNRGFALRAADIVVVEERWLIKSTSGKISRESNKAKYLAMRSEAA